MIKLVVFDMAGTTINEENVVYKTLQTVINNQGFNISLDQVLAEGAGREKSEAIKNILKVYAGNDDHNLADKIYGDFMRLLADAYENLQVRAQPNAEELFRNLRKDNIKIVLNTGYDAETAELLVKKLGWKKGTEYDSLISSSDVENNRPDPEMIELAMDIYNIENSKEIIKVGDSIIDIEEGRNAGCRYSIGITTGALSYRQLESAGPDFIINNLMDLLPIIANARE